MGDDSEKSSLYVGVEKMNKETMNQIQDTVSKLKDRYHQRVYRRIRSDADGDVEWITVNGTHIPIDESGTSVGGPSALQGKDFSKAKSTSSKQKGGKGSGGSKSAEKGKEAGGKQPQKVSITGKARDWGWEDKDVEKINKLVDAGAGLEWTGGNNGKLRVTVGGKRLAVVEPVIGLHGDPVWSVIGKVGSTFDREREYKSLSTAVTYLRKSIEQMKQHTSEAKSAAAKRKA